jgi:adenosylcobyric acid synthase
LTRGALLVCGTSSSAGKSTVVTGLCRLLARTGVRVAPFKAMNMSNNAVVATDGGEMARAQYAQALASGVPPVTAMNPVLLKPLGARRSEVIVRGRVANPDTPWTDLFATARAAFAELRDTYDVVVVEGAGGAAEINLLDRDLANLPLARSLGIPAVLVADVDRGGMLAAVTGTVALLPDDLRSLLRGVVVNKFRGDPVLLQPGLDVIADRTGIPVLGVLPWLDGNAVDSEDSLDLDALGGTVRDDALDVAVVRFPHASNWSDVEPLLHDPAVSLRLVTSGAALGDPDLVVLPGSRRVVADLRWLRARRLDTAVASSQAVVLGICGGYQMLGDQITDRDGVEERAAVRALGLLPVATTYERDKLTRWRHARALGHPVCGFDMRHGRVTSDGDSWVDGDDSASRGRVFGTNLHGLFEHDDFRRAFLTAVAARRNRTVTAPTVSFGGIRRDAAERIADALTHDVPTLTAMIA